MKKSKNIIIVILIILLIVSIILVKNIESEENNNTDYTLEETNIKKLIDGKWENDDRIFFFDTEKNKISFEDTDYYCLGNCDYTVIQNNDNYKILINNFDTNGDIKFNEIIVTVQKDKTNTITIGKQEFNKVVNESNNDNFTWFSVFFIVLIVFIFVIFVLY